METSSAEEQARLQNLPNWQILDSSPEAVLQRLTEYAAQLCTAPIAVITLNDTNRQWFTSSIGWNTDEPGEANSFCIHAIRNKAPLIVQDALAHPLFQQNPHVIGPPHVRFYAGIPLMSSTGAAIGALAVMDTVPRQVDERELSALSLLAEQVIMHLELSRQRKELEQVIAERNRINQALQRQTLHLQEAQHIAEIGSWELDTQTKQIFLSEQACRILGIVYQDAPEAVSSFLQRIHVDDQAYVTRMLEDAIRYGYAMDGEYRVVRQSGETQFIRGRVHVSLRKNNQRIIYGTMQDVTRQKRIQEHLHLLDASVSRVNDIVMITEAEPHDEPGPRIVFVNHAFERITGYTKEEVMGKSPRFLQGPKTQRSELDRVRAAIEKREPVLIEIINYTQTGQEFWLESHITPVSQNGGQVTHFVAIERDITQRKLAEAQIERLAFYDALTQLPNRRLLLDRLHQAVAVIRRGHHMGALFFIDLDNFKTLNDTLGHDKGDLLLQQVALRLQSCVRSTNTVARLGGDEFVVMLEDLSEHPPEAAAQAEHVGEKILRVLNQLFQLDQHVFHCSASIGVALFDWELRNVEELLQRADIAMYQAKTSGRNALRFFDPEMQAVVSQRLKLEGEIRTALQNQEFVLHYQPQTSANGKVIGVEALVRWHHPQQGLVLPGNFIRLAEETGLILPLGRWVLESACRQLALWANHPAYGRLPVAVNISARQFRQPDFVEQVIQVLDDTGANPEDLKLELTESILVEDLEGTVFKMRTLREKGVSFSLDDFGTGYSSLSYLKRLPLNQLKIDQAFVKDVLTDPNDAAIARTIVALGQTLGLNVIAEGVETMEQRNFLAQEGCHAYQGYFISHPLPADQIHA